MTPAPLFAIPGLMALSAWQTIVFPPLARRKEVSMDAEAGWSRGDQRSAE
jgi:hypothetical protein